MTKGNGDLAQHHLQRVLASLPGEEDAQRGMTIEGALPTLGEVQGIGDAGNEAAELLNVNPLPRFLEGVKEDALLGAGEPIDALHFARWLGVRHQSS